MMEWHKLTEKTGYVSIGNAFVPGYFLTENELVLIDSGPIESLRLMELLESNHWKVRAVIHTHIHIDHVSNNDLLEKMFPDIVFYASRIETEAIKSPENMVAMMGFWTIEQGQAAMKIYPHHFTPVDLEKKVLNIDGSVFELIDLPGHSIGHMAVVTPDHVCCLGDAIVSEDVLNMSKQPYLLQFERAVQSMEKVRELSYPYYMLAHKSVETPAAIPKLVTDNVAKEYQLCRMALEVLRRPMNQEDALDGYLRALRINRREGLGMAVTEHSAWERYQYLIDQGRIEYRDGLLYRKDL